MRGGLIYTLGLEDDSKVEVGSYRTYSENFRDKIRVYYT